LKSNKLLGIDYGATNIGLAVSDDRASFAMPLQVVKNDKDVFNKLKQVISDHGITTIVIGVPQDFQPHKNKISDEIDAFMKQLHKQVEIPIVTFDESFTTQQAEDMLRRQGLSSRKQKGRADMYAASLILEGYINANT